jgi:hypothetical protein
MNEKKYMSGSELRQYLHISTRKMKYLMDHDYIRHEKTEHATHKYRVLVKDAEVFKYRMENELGFLAELTGLFSNRTEWHPVPHLEATDANCADFRLWLENKWRDLPDALPTLTAAKLIGCQPQRLREIARNGGFTAIKIGSAQYLPKEEFIAYASSPEKLAKPTSNAYKELLLAFKAQQCREREKQRR